MELHWSPNRLIMNDADQSSKKIHEGQNLKRFREMLGIKQETMAFALGGEWSQKRISVMESRAKINRNRLAEIAELLKIPEEAIRNFDEETALLSIRKSYEYSGAGQYHNVVPIGQLTETLNAILQLHTENKKLYERLLESEREKTTLFKMMTYLDETI